MPKGVYIRTDIQNLGRHIRDETIRERSRQGTLRFFESKLGLMEDRFLKRIYKNGPEIIPSSPCWYLISNRTGLIISNRRGGVWDGEKSIVGHRFSYEFFKGKIPEGLFACHHCDNPPCINYEHLYAGTAQDNVDDMWKRNRWNRPDYSKRDFYGENNPRAKLTWYDVKEIRSLYESGERIYKLSDKFGVSRTNIGSIVKYETWK